MKIAVTGPESCGKTVLSKHLANVLNLPHLPELCRDYLGKLDRPYNREDVLQMARDQHAQYKRQVAEATSFVADTESLVMLIWYKEKYGQESLEIRKMWDAEQFNLYLLCVPDIPWDEDPMRENPFDRDRLFELYRSELESSGRKYALVSGLGEARKLNALFAVNSSL